MNKSGEIDIDDCQYEKQNKVEKTKEQHFEPLEALKKCTRFGVQKAAQAVGGSVIVSAGAGGIAMQQLVTIAAIGSTAIGVGAGIGAAASIIPIGWSYYKQVKADSKYQWQLDYNRN